MAAIRAALALELADGVADLVMDRQVARLERRLWPLHPVTPGLLVGDHLQSKTSIVHVKVVVLLHAKASQHVVEVSPIEVLTPRERSVGLGLAVNHFNLLVLANLFLAQWNPILGEVPLTDKADGSVLLPHIHPEHVGG